MNMLTWLGAGSAALLAIGALVRAVWRISRRTVLIVDAVRELTPNGGQSIKDAVTRTDRTVRELGPKVDQNTQELCDLKRRLDEHLADG